MRLKSLTISPLVAISLVFGTISVLVATTAAAEPATGSVPTTGDLPVAVHGTVTLTDDSELQKMIGVDFRPDGHSRMEQLQQQTWSATSGTEEHEVKDQDGEQQTERLSSTSVTNDSCLLFADEFDTLDNSVWRVKKKKGFARHQRKKNVKSSLFFFFFLVLPVARLDIDRRRKFRGSGVYE